MSEADDELLLRLRDCANTIARLLVENELVDGDALRVMDAATRSLDTHFVSRT